MREAVSDVLIDRARETEGMTRMLAVSGLAHAALMAVIVLLPSGWLSPAAEPETASLMISIGGVEGPETGGMTPISGRTAQALREPDAKPRVEPAPAATPPEMVLPSPTAKPAPRTPAKPVEKPAERSTSKTPTTGAEVKSGAAKVDTGAPPIPFGGLSSGGGGGGGAYTDFGNFCCPDYLVAVNTLIKRNWQRSQGVAATVVVRMTVSRDGRISNVQVVKPSGQAVLDLAAQRAVVLTEQLPQLPREYTEPTLTINLIFQYQR